jgi:antitoxin (DNA-binding transcriptional repressor) of toxin-antitoxin stability system
LPRGKHSVAEAKSQLSTLIDRALAGDEVVITRHGTPIVEMRAVATTGRVVTKEANDRLRANRVSPERPATQSAADLIRQMRDEDWR